MGRDKSDKSDKKSKKHKSIKKSKPEKKEHLKPKLSNFSSKPPAELDPEFTEFLSKGRS